MKYDLNLPNDEIIRVALAAGLQEDKVTLNFDVNCNFEKTCLSLRSP